MPLLPDTHSSLSFLPLSVALDGEHYAMTPAFEPLYAPDGALVAVEMLSRLRLLSDPQVVLSPARFFTWATPEEVWRVFTWQVNTLTCCLPWFAANAVTVTLNVSRVQARACAAHGEVVERLSALAPWLRLEINEHFLRADTDARDDPLLTLLGRACPLWLDDFGTGGANLTALLSGRFEVIKVDRAVVDALGRTGYGLATLTALKNLALERGVLTVFEGVESAQDLARVHDCGAWGLQGWLWPQVSLYGLGRLSMTCPRLSGGAAQARPIHK